MEAESRIFPVTEYIRQSDDKPIKSVVLANEESTVSVWHLHTGQEVAAHVHPNGQDTWMVISGAAEYYEGRGVVSHLKAGEIAIAKAGQVHGAINRGQEPFIFVSVVAAGNTGYALAEK